MSAVAEEDVMRTLYQQLLDGWNRRSASAMARLFVRDGLAVGFDGTAVVHAVAGMVPPGKHELKTDRNTVQTLTLVKRDGGWAIAVFQNTPAKYDGRPADVERLTTELRTALEARGIGALDGESA